jgi:GntR family transcriptional regulator
VKDTPLLPEGRFSEQIATGMRRAILQREVDPGSHLPSLREMARETGRSINTVKAAYERLVDDGLIFKSAGATSGYRVTNDPFVHARMSSLRDEAQEFVRRLRSRGFSSSEIVEVVKELVK